MSYLEEKEVRDRVRRIETRLTKLMIHAGMTPLTEPPRFFVDEKAHSASVVLPSPHTSLKEILDNIPATWNGQVGVFLGDELVATVSRAGTG